MTQPTGALVPVAWPVQSIFSSNGHPPGPLWPGKQVSLVAGSSGAGKTTLLLQLLAAWSKGETFAGFAGPPPPYGLIAADRAVASYQQVAAAVGLPWSALAATSLVDDATIDLRQLEHNPFDLLSSLLAHLRKTLPSGPQLVMIDPLMVYLGVDLNKYNLVASKLIQLNRLCQKFDFTIIGTHHATKPRSDWSFKRPQDRIAGSGALLAFTSTQGFLSGSDELAEPEATWCEWTTVSHHHPAVTLKLSRNAIGLFEPVGVKSEYETKHGAGPQPIDDPETAFMLVHNLTSVAMSIYSSMKPDHVHTRAELHSIASTVRSGDRALATLVDKGLVLKIGHGQYKKAGVS